MTRAPAAPPAAHPVAEAYTRLSAAFPGLQVALWDTAPPSGDGWVCAAGLAAGGQSLDTFLAWDDAQIVRDYGGVPGRTSSRASHCTATPGPPAC